jgi:hypothetical protein
VGARRLIPPRRACRVRANGSASPERWRTCPRDRHDPTALVSKGPTRPNGSRPLRRRKRARGRGPCRGALGVAVGAEWRAARLLAWRPPARVDKKSALSSTRRATARAQQGAEAALWAQKLFVRRSTRVPVDVERSAAHGRGARGAGRGARGAPGRVLRGTPL